MKDKLEGIQTKRGSKCLEEPNKEVKYLKKEVRSKHKSIDSSEVELLKKVANVRCKIKLKEDGDSLKFSFVQVIAYGKIFAFLVDMGATHSFLSKKAAKSFGKKAKMKREWSAFKAVKSTTKVVLSVMQNTEVRVGSWFGKLDLRIVNLDDHSMVLGQDFLRLAQAIAMVD